MKYVVLWVVLFATIFSCKNSSMQADMIITGGMVYTMNDDQPEAEAIAIKDGAIVAVGSNEDIEKYYADGTRHIRLKGEMVTPGLIEGHGHFLMMGYSLMELNLLDTKNFQEIIDSVEARVAETTEGQWIKGRGWHQEKWDQEPEQLVDGFPTNDLLNKAAPNHPVILQHASGHAALVNDRALQLAGITDTTPDPAGGTIVRDEKGKATGLLEENAERLVTKVYDAHRENRTESEKQEEFLKVVRLAEENCLKHGITAFHDAASTIAEIEDLQAYHRDSGLNIRLSLMVYEPWEKLETYISSHKPWHSKDQHLLVNSIKQYYDGALGSRGALLLEPYADDPGNSGHLTLDTSEFRKINELAAREGYQLNTHAIGDSANRAVLDHYEATFDQYPEAQQQRWRIEHAQHLHPADIPRFAKLEVIPSMQSIHCISDAPYVEERLGTERAQNGAYMWKDLINSGAVLMEGTDVPVERLDPFRNFYAAATRQTKEGWAFYPEQAKSRKEALRGYTINNAYGMHLDQWVGTLEKGKQADITILDTDLMTCSKDAILQARAKYTIIDGEVKYRLD